MGIIKQGILGGFSGKVGSVVGTSWKGINVMKARPLSVANPKTAAQIAQRSLIGNASKFASEILATIIQPLWNRFASQASGYNDFVSANLSLFADALPSVIADLEISKGKMAKTTIDAAVATGADDDVEVTWTDDSGSGFKLATDIAYVVVIDTSTSQVYGFETVATRADASVTVDMPIEGGEDYEVYLAFKRADGTVVSNTDHISTNAV